MIPQTNKERLEHIIKNKGACFSCSCTKPERCSMFNACRTYAGRRIVKYRILHATASYIQQYGKAALMELLL